MDKPEMPVQVWGWMTRGERERLGALAREAGKPQGATLGELVRLAMAEVEGRAAAGGVSQAEALAELTKTSS